MLVRVGPQTDTEVQTDIEKYFSRILLLTGMVYYQAKQEEVDAMWEGMAATLECHDSFTDPMARMRGLLPPGKSCILDEHLEQTPLDVDGWIADLDQHPSSRAD